METREEVKSVVMDGLLLREVIRELQFGACMFSKLSELYKEEEKERYEMIHQAGVLARLAILVQEEVDEAVDSGEDK